MVESRKNQFPDVLRMIPAVEEIISRTGEYACVVTDEKTGEEKVDVIDYDILNAIKGGAWEIYRDLVRARKKSFADRAIRENTQDKEKSPQSV